MTIKRVFAAAAVCLLFLIPNVGIAQKIYYTGIDVPVDLPPAYPQYKDYSSYDLAMISLVVPENTSLKRFEELPYEIKIGNLKKSTSGDFHVVASLFGLAGRLTSKSTSSGFVSLEVHVYDRSGSLVKSARLKRDNFNISLGRKLTDEEAANSNFINTLIIQNSIDTALATFNASLTGSKIKPEIMFAALKDVKDKPELKEFSKQPDEIYRAVQKNDPVILKSTLEGFVPYWEKMAVYAGEGEVNEVKRAAYQNLIVYHTLAGSKEKAREYIALYKPIDKEITAAFGLYRVRHSELCEKNLNEFYPEIKTPAAGGNPVSIAALVDHEEYMNLSGTITLKGKRKPGTYTGTVKITKMNLPPGTPGLFPTDKNGDDVLVTTADGQKFTVLSSDVDFIKVSDNELYTTKELGAVMGVGGYIAIMKTTFVSPRIAVYRSVLPENDEYFIIKAGDKEGLVHTPLKARKKLAEYLSDCADLSQKLKDKIISEDEKEEKIAQLYTECK